MSDALRWTTDTPTEQGWYWMRGKNVEPEVCDIYEAQYARCLYIARSNGVMVKLSGFVAIYDVEFAGPIPMPEEP